jgi:hypothetical protein
MANDRQRGETTSEPEVSAALTPTQKTPIASSADAEHKFTAPEDVPQNVFDFMVNYLNACMISNAEAFPYVRFFSEYADTYVFSYLHAGIRVGKWEINSFERINENLYAVNYYYEHITPREELIDGEWVIYEDDWVVDYTGNAPNFVGILDGEMFVIINVREVPEELAEGLDREKYRVTGDNFVNVEDLVPVQVG